MRLWDLYDDKLVNTGKVIPSGDEVPDGFYHIAVEIWIINKNKELLMLKNTIDYSRRYPGSFRPVCGNLLSEESIDDSIKRIIEEKIGLDVSYEKIFISDPIKRDPYKYAYITCVISAEVDINKIKFKDGNSSKAKFVDKNKLVEMCEDGEVAYYMISRINDEILKYLD